MSKLIIITSVNTASTVEANGQDVMICDKDRVIEVKGACGELKINGMRNKIKASQVQSLVVAGEDNALETGTLGDARIAGSNNQVTWVTAANGSAPGFEQHGPGNRLTHRPAQAAPAQAQVKPVQAEPKPAPATSPATPASKPSEEKSSEEKPEPGKKPEAVPANKPATAADVPVKPAPMPPGNAPAKPGSPAPSGGAPKPGGNGGNPSGSPKP